MKPITEIAKSLEIEPAHLEPYGHWKAKIALKAFRDRPRRGKLVLVSAITPTPAGEGKTTTSVGLAQGLAKIGVRSAVALREPSLGPVFGMKGGGAGGGASEVVPVMDINMHFNGDFHAVSAAHNLLAALVDNHLHHGNAAGLDSRRVVWRRTLDMNDRALRDIVIGLGGRTEGVPRETGFDITAASEVMAVLCLADGIADLKARLGRIVVGYRPDASPVTASDMNAVGAMAALLRDAIKPNLVQTTEGVPAFVHGGPFANIAHGTNTITATKAALSYADIVVTEAGFAFELGAEKFFDINCRYGGFAPACTVLVTTIRALKMHGGAPLPEVSKPDVATMMKGFGNMEKHLENIKKFNQPCVVAINHFPTDSTEELETLKLHCEALGLQAVVSKSFSEGGKGCVEMAEVVRDLVAKSEPQFRPLYDWNDSIEKKIATIAHEMYGAQAVDYTARAKRDRQQLEKAGFGKLPVCIAKTQQSLSDNPALLGRPKDFLVTVREIQLAAGAGFVVPITGEIMRMPGLPKEPLAGKFDLSEDGEIEFAR
jgi:formate--tetrahydrofolate ligase